MIEALYMFGALVVTIAFGVPIPIAVAIATLVGYFLIDIPVVALAQAMYTGVEPFPLLTVPLFVLAGALMERGGLALRIVAIAQSLIGNYSGSLGLVAVLGCTFFAALSGSGPATTAAIGAVMIPAMIRERYDPAFGGAIAASGGALGSLIPPSNLMIIYGVVSDNSIPRMFLAGVLPGIIASAFLLLVTYMIARRRGYGGQTDPQFFLVAGMALVLGRQVGDWRPGPHSWWDLRRRVHADRSGVGRGDLCLCCRPVHSSRAYMGRYSFLPEDYGNDFGCSPDHRRACKSVRRTSEPHGCAVSDRRIPDRVYG